MGASTAENGRPDAEAMQTQILRATLNILEDFQTEKVRARESTQAVLNILTDFEDEKEDQNQSNRALLNILDDFECEKDASLLMNRAVINILDDLDIERTTTAALNADLEGRVRERTADLARSEERFRLLVDGVKDYAILMLDPQGIVLTWNAGAQRMKGYRAEEIVGQHFSRFYPAEDQASGKPQMELQRALQCGSFEDEGTRIRKDGSRFVASVILTAVYDENQRHVGFAKVTRDITERERADDHLRMQALLLDQAYDPILIWEIGGTIEYWNLSAERLYGYSSQEAIGQSSHELLHTIHPNGKDALEAVLRQDGRWEGELHHQTKEGRWVTVDSRHEAFERSPGCFRVFEANRDITDRKLAERRFRTQNAVSRVLADAASLADATPGIIRAICEAEGWEFGSIWEVDPAAKKLCCREIWHRPGFSGDAMVAETRGLTFDIGQGLPGRVWATGEMLAISDIAADDNYLRGEMAIQAGLRSALAFPIFVGNEVTGVIDLAAREIRDPDGLLREMFTAVGRQVGQFIERHRAEETLRASEDQFRTMANSIPQLAWMAHADGFIFWYNQRWHDFTGTTPEQMEGWGWQRVHDPDVLPKVMEKWQGAIAAGRPFEMEFPLRGADGRFRMFLTRIQPMMDWQGRVERWFGTNTDVDELKQMEASLRDTQLRLHSTLAAGCIGTWTWDIGNDRLIADQFTARMFSLDPDETAKGLPAQAYLQAIYDEDRPGVVDALHGAIQSCGHYDTSYRVRQEKGECRWLQARGRVESDAAGNALNFHGAVMDITERKLAEEAVQHLNADLENRVIERTAQLEAANKELEAFSYSVSHDLRAPLRAIDGFSRIVLREYAPSMTPEAQEYLQDIRASTQKMGQLVDDLLAFSRLGRQPVKKEAVSPANVVRQCLEELRGEQEGRRVEIHLDELPGCSGDAALLKQVWMNLLANALKYTSKCEVTTIEVGSYRDKETGDCVYFVKDNGVGFDMGYAHKLFGVFQRLHRAEDYQGTGVGLAIVQRIVHRHGGRVWADAQPDKGASFFFTLASGGHVDE
jgi:PAS domain S-box-containing protein